MFREEALAALQRPEYGSVHVGHGWRDSVVVGTAVVLAGALLAFCALGTVTRKANGDRTDSIQSRGDRLDTERRARIRYDQARIHAAADRAALLDSR